MFILDGKQLLPDQPFSHQGIKYPSNWLALSSADERAAIGIIDAPDPAPYDARFYYGYDSNGNLLPRDHGQLVSEWTEQTRATANGLLRPTDWMIIRQVDNGVPADSAVKSWRESVRLAAGSKVYEIEHTADTPALAAYITGADYPAWPSDPNAPVSPVTADRLQFLNSSEEG